MENSSGTAIQQLQDLQWALNKTALVASFDHNGTIIEINDKFVHVLGFSKEEILGKPFTNLISEELSPLLKKEMTSNIFSGSAWKGQISHRTKSGFPLWVEASLQPILDSTGKVSRLIYIAFDITEQKTVGEAFANHKALLLKMMASAPVGFFLADARGHCEVINQKWSEMSGLKLKNAMGLGWLQAIHPEDRLRVTLAWKDLIKKGTPLHLEYRYRHPDGREIPVLASGVLLKEPRIADSRILRVEQDLTEQKRNENVINAQKAQMILNSKLTSLGEMAGGIAHEINNPLAIILGSAELLQTTLQNPKADPVRLNRLTETIVNTTNRIAKIIRSLRAIARDGEFDPFELTPLAPILTETLEMCAAKARADQISLKIPQIDPNLKLKCRPTQISQALLNLLSNAVWAVQNCEEKWIEVQIHDRHDSIEIWVTDSGPGISREDREKIFNPFFTTKPIGKGTGLGLSVSKGVIESHGGTLFLDEKCVNTRFVMVLPQHHSNSLLQMSS